MREMARLSMQRPEGTRRRARGRDSMLISAATGGNKEESEGERWHAQVCGDQREPGSEDDASADEAVLCAFLSSPDRDSFWATLGGPILGPIG
jgi:hypothetical protein